MLLDAFHEEVFQLVFVVNLEVIPFCVDVVHRMEYLFGLLVADALVIEAVLQACAQCPMVVGADNFITRRGLPSPHAAIDIDVSAPAARRPERFEVGREV